VADPELAERCRRRCWPAIYCRYKGDCPYKSLRRRRGRRLCLFEGVCNMQVVR